MSDSRVSGLYKLSVPGRLDELRRMGWLSEQAADKLRAGRQVISAQAADKMVENVLGVFGLPLAIAPNFIVNSKEYLVPLVVEEPSIVAALSSAARLARPTGGFTAELDESLLAGQIHIAGIDDADAATDRLVAAREELLAFANSVHPRLARRGGGVREIEFRQLRLRDGSAIIAVHLLVDTCDAMGANLVNTLCETIAPRIAEISAADVALRILSNLVDRSVCNATVRYATDALAVGTMPGEWVRDRIVLASEIASADRYRAATHNKGIMNGIDALAIATGNDWRAIEAGAHASAVRNGEYSPLATWSVADSGELLGNIRIALKPGIVGGTVSANPGAALGLAICGAESAAELTGLMASVGLAQNFAALRALATSGIQQGHMRLHARSVASAAGANDGQIDDVVERLIASGDIKTWKAKEILQELTPVSRRQNAVSATAAGKTILLGEHAVVYGRYALAVPIIDAVRAFVSPRSAETTLSIAAWGVNGVVTEDCDAAFAAVVSLILDRLDIREQSFEIDVSTRLPPGMGLGSSAAVAVAIVRALATCVGVELSDDRVNEIAFECETIAHGTPSGIDNTLSCFAKPMLFRNAGTLDYRVLELGEVPPLVIGLSQQSGPTHEQVAGVRARFNRAATHYEAIFDRIGELSVAGAKALTAGAYDELGLLMNICHGLLNSIEVSTPELEAMISITRDAGACGAKLTGAGGGGAMIALCPGNEERVASALNRAGYETLSLTMDRGV